MNAPNSSPGRNCSGQPQAEKHIASIIISVLGLPGNVIVIILIFRAKPKKSTTTCLMLSLAIADIINLLGVNVTGFLVQFVDKMWCYKWSMLLFTIPGKVAANLTLAMIALERYNAIVKTMKSFMRLSRRKIIISVAVSWVIGWTLSTLIVLHKFGNHSSSCLRTLDRNCTLNGNFTLNGDRSRRPRRSDPSPSHFEAACWSTLLILGYIIPLLVVVFCYSSILKGLFIDGTVLGEVVADKTHLNEKKRLVRCLFVITFVFVVCNVPAIVILALKHFDTSVPPIQKRLYYEVQKYLSCASSLLNPFIYALQSENYRNQIKQLFCKSEENKNVVKFPPVANDSKL